MSDDTISRKATIDAMEGVDWYHINKGGRLVHGANSKDDEPLYKAKDVYTVLNTMPSAQPKKRTEERTETHACDLISRQAAIGVMGKAEWAKERLRELPSAQPEVLACGEGELSAQSDIVLCEDCRHWKQETFNDGYCIEMDLRMCDADFYCGYAERRTDDLQ